MATLKTCLRPNAMRPTVSHPLHSDSWSRTWSQPLFSTASLRLTRARTCQFLMALLALLASVSTTAWAHAPVTLSATFTPEHLGRASTVGLDINVREPGDLPTPLAEVNVRYPAGLGIGFTGLGIDTCSAQRLELSGTNACPADAVMGTGSALTALQIGPQILHEETTVTVVRAPERNGNPAMFFYAAGSDPVIARALFIGELLPAQKPFGGRIRITVPPIPTLLGQYVAIERLHLVLAPPRLTYYEHTYGKTIAYHPKGIPLPAACPHGGFPFSATVVFLNGLEARGDTKVRCPMSRGAH